MNHTTSDELKPFEYELPKAPRDVMESWMPRLSAMAVVTGLFAATEAQLLSSLPDAGDRPDSGPGVAVRFFAYSGLFLNIGATLSAVILLIAIASLPSTARGIYISCEHGFPRNVFHGTNAQVDELNQRLSTCGWDDIDLMKAFGLAQGCGLLLFHCIICFVGGWVCVFFHIGVALWMNESIVVAAIVTPMAILASGPPFIIYLFAMGSASCTHCNVTRASNLGRI